MAFNSQLGAAARSPFVAGLVVFLTGVAALALVVAILRPAMPSLADMAVAPKTAWLGGVIATAYIIAIVTVTPRLGVGATTALILSGQLATAMLIDHFGLFGAIRQVFNLWRLVGLLMMLGGAAVIRTH